MSSQKMHQVPDFQGNDSLKFTREEQEAIRAAEQGVRPTRRPAARKSAGSSGGGLWLALAAALAYLILKD